MTNYTFEPNKFTILIVDDLPKNIQVLGNVLKNQNYVVEFATSGQKALDWLKQKEFDLLLLDVMMPEMDGFEVCRNIRLDIKHEDMPVIFLTASSDKESIVKGFVLGGQDYITKPFDTKELLVRVKTHLELRQSKQKLKDLNKWLEKKVEERTVELKEANIHLAGANEKLKNLSEELLSIDQEKSEFLKIISHEIRTPLNAIKGFLSLLKRKIREEDILKYFNYIDDSSYRLERFSLQALLITELRTGKYPIKKEKTELKSLIDKVISSHLLDKINEKKLNLNFNFETEDFKINVDKNLILNCLTSIINNAIQYANTEGIIEFKACQSGGETIIEIIDDGPGFSEKAKSNLFKLFVPDQVYTGQGKGLDLAIANLIMMNHQGRIEVANNPKKGATIKLYLPD